MDSGLPGTTTVSASPDAFSASSQRRVYMWVWMSTTGTRDPVVPAACCAAPAGAPTAAAAPAAAINCLRLSFMGLLCPRPVTRTRSAPAPGGAQLLQVVQPERLHAVVVEHASLDQLGVLALQRDRFGIEARVLDGDLDLQALQAVALEGRVALDDPGFLADDGRDVDGLRQADGFDHQRVAFPVSPRRAAPAGQDVLGIDVASVEEHAPHLVVRLVDDRELLGPLDEFHWVAAAQEHG